MKKNNRKVNIIEIVILAISLLFILLNIKQISVFPWQNEISFDRPKEVEISDNGNLAVIDSLSSRVIILDSKNEIKVLIVGNSLSSVTPVFIEDVALTDSYIYILDYKKNSFGSSINSYRVLVYDYNGNYLKTIFNSEYDENKPSQYLLLDIDCVDNKIYGLFSYSDDLTCVYKCDITNNQMEGIKMYSMDNHEIFSVNYNAKDDIITTLSHDGYVSAWINDKQIYKEFKNDNYDISYCEVDKEGRLVFIDHNKKVFSSYYDANFIDYPYIFSGVNFTLYNNSTYVVNNVKNYIAIYDHYSSELTYIRNPKRMLKDTLLCLTFWLSLILSLILILKLIIKYTIKLIKKLKKKRKIDKQKKDEGILTTSSLYGSIFFVVFICVLISSLILGNYYYNSTFNIKKASTYNSATSISLVSNLQLGDMLTNIKSDDDYKSESYNKVLQIVNSICNSGNINDNGVDLEFIIYQFDNDTTKIIYEPYNEYRIGTNIIKNDAITTNIELGIQKAKEGSFFSGITKYNNVKVYGVFAPIYNSKNEIVGAVVPLMQVSSLSSEIIIDISVKILELITLLAGLAMVIAEVKLIKELYIEQRKKHLENDYSTLVEADRSLRIFSRIPGSICTLFVTLLGNKILVNLGIESNAFLLALPLSICTIFFGVSNIFGGILFKYHPKRYIRFGLFILIFSSFFFVLAMALNNYILLIIGSILAGLGSGICKSSVQTIRLSGKNVKPRYSLVVFSGVETSIASAISASLGSVFKNIFGDNGLFALFVIVCLISLFINEYFVGNDLNIIKEKQEKKKINIKSFIITQIKFLFRPSILVCILLITLPFDILKLFKSFVMPILNESNGYPEVIIGLITFVIEVFTLFIIPLIIKNIRKLHGFTWMIIGYLLLAVCLLFFGITGSMFSFVFVLLVISILHPITSTMVADEMINQSNKANLNANDTAILRNLACSLAEIIGPIILSFTILLGNKSFGFIWMFIVILLAILALPLIISKSLFKKKKSV